MSMQAASLDILEKADVPPSQARAFVQVIELELDARSETLATKRDLDGVKSYLELKIEGSRKELELKIEGSKSELELKIEGSKSELDLKVEGFKNELALKIERSRNEVELKVEGIKSELVRWIFLVILGQTAVLLGAGYFFLNQLLPLR